MTCGQYSQRVQTHVVCGQHSRKMQMHRVYVQHGKMVHEVQSPDCLFDILCDHAVLDAILPCSAS